MKRILMKRTRKKTFTKLSISTWFCRLQGLSFYNMVSFFKSLSFVAFFRFNRLSSFVGKLFCSSFHHVLGVVIPWWSCRFQLLSFTRLVIFKMVSFFKSLSFVVFCRFPFCLCFLVHVVLDAELSMIVSFSM